jgi:hypothetical protein
MGFPFGSSCDSLRAGGGSWEKLILEALHDDVNDVALLLELPP